MTSEELQEHSRNIHATIAANAHSAEAFREREFVEYMCELLVDAGEMEDYLCCPYKARGLKVDAYDFDDDLSSLTLVVAIWNDNDDPDANRVPDRDVDAMFTRCVNFFKKSRSRLHSRIEIANEAHDLAGLIFENKNDINSVKVVLVTDGATRDRPAELEMDEDVQITKILWDIKRTIRFVSTGEQEGISIDFGEVSSEPLPVVRYDTSSGIYESYLGYIPGQVLADIYEKWGNRLLEMNVRVFLSARGKVNKGIRETIRNEPEMFCAYNNGIAAFAREASISVMGDGRSQLSKVIDFQIVNGGQTTASLYHTWKKYKADLSKIQVQMKLTVVGDPDSAGSIVPKISEYSNTQNKIQMSDLLANDPPHPELHALSQTIAAPDPTGGSKQTFWFYEKARGSYEETRNLTARTPAQKKKFDELRPKRQRFDKNLFGKVWNSYLLLPYVVSLGAQKNFVRFNEWLREQEEEDWSAFFKKTVALVLLWKSAETTVRRQNFEGYRHNIVTYTLAWLFHLTERRIDLDRIWARQEIDSLILDVIEEMCHVVNSHIRETELNVTEWCKKEKCWESLLKKKFDLPSNFEETYYTTSTANDYNPEIVSEREALEFCTSIESKDWFALAKWLKDRQFLTGKARSQCFNMGKFVGNGRRPSVVLSRACKKAWEDAQKRGWDPSGQD